MKILMLCNLVPNKEGAFEQFLISFSAIVNNSADNLVLVFAGDPIESVKRKLVNNNVVIYTITNWNDSNGDAIPFAMVKPSLRFIKDELPDVIACHFCDELPILKLIKKTDKIIKKSLLWVWHQRQQISNPKTIFHKKFSKIKRLSRKNVFFIALYEGGKKSLLDRGVPKSKIRVIHNGIRGYDVSVGNIDNIRKELNLNNKAPIVTTVSSLIKRKRLDIIINAWKILKASNVNNIPYVLIIGAGPEEIKLKEIIKKNNLNEYFFFLGRRNDVQRILYQSDIFVLTSDAEASPLALIESMSVGIPAISTDAGAANELIKNDVTGFVITRGDYKGLAEKIKLLISSRDKIIDMGKHAQLRWSEYFTLEKMTREHVDFYNQCYKFMDKG